MVPGVRGIRVQLYDTHQSQHRHSRHDHGEKPRSECTDVWQFHAKFKFVRRKRHHCQKSNKRSVSIFRRSLILLLFQTDFEWNDSERASVLGSFYWLHWVLQLPGGLLARQFGAKCIFGLSNFFMFVMSLLMPILARWDIKGLIIARTLQGFIGVSVTLFSFIYG